MKLIYYALIAFYAWRINCSSAQQDNKIIEILGNKKINTDTILYYSGLIPSDKIEKNQVNKAIKNLYCLGYFLEIHITVQVRK